MRHSDSIALRFGTFISIFYDIFTSRIIGLKLMFRMKAEKLTKLYIVKLPNNYCGIGACMINHPKMVRLTQMMII